MSLTFTKNTTLWLTQPTEQAQTIIKALQKKAIKVKSEPLIHIQSVSDSKVLQNKIKTLSADLLIFVSRHAVQAIAPFCTQLPKKPQHYRWLAIGQATQSALQKITSEEVIFPEEANSEALLQLPVLEKSKVQGKKVIIFRGASGRALLGDTLCVRGAKVTYLTCYNAYAVTLSHHAFKDFSLTDILYITSEKSLNVIANSPVSVSGQLRKSQLLVSSQRLAKLAKAVGFEQIHVSQDPTLSSLMAALGLS